MKLKSSFVFGILALASAQMASAVPIVINITGATAFRDAARTAIINFLGGDGVCLRGAADLNLDGAPTASNLRIMRGFNGGQEYIVRLTHRGSTEGILDTADGNTIDFLKANTVLTATTGAGTIAGATEAGSCENGIPRWSFSDVDKALSTRPNEVFYSTGLPEEDKVGVVPFMFVAGEGAPAGISNMTDQIFELISSTGAVNASFFTGAPSTTTVVGTGRNNGSGSRATVLSETRYGSFRNVYQYNCVVTGATENVGALGEVSLFADNGNSGHVSNSGIRAILNRPRTGMTFGGAPFDGVFVSYLTVSDATAATGYVPATGLISGGEGAIPMTYNGVRYSVNNVVNGAYTLWGYQQFYMVADATPAEIAFDTALRLALPGNLGSAGIDLGVLNVDRVNGDGGLIQPQQ